MAPALRMVTMWAVVNGVPSKVRQQQARWRGGSLKGRATRATRTPTAGIRFDWMNRTIGPVLRVVATWTDKRGRPRHTSYSVERNGLEGALQKAVAARTSAGAPAVDYPAMLAALQAAYRKGP